MAGELGNWVFHLQCWLNSVLAIWAGGSTTRLEPEGKVIPDQTRIGTRMVVVRPPFGFIYFDLDTC